MGRDQFELVALRAGIACYEAQDGPTLLQRLQPGFEAVGFEYFSVVEAIAEPSGQSLRPILARAHDPWQAYYREHRLEVEDLRIRRARASARPFFCREILRDDPDVTVAEHRFFEAANRFGLRDSYVLPHRTAGGRVFAAVLIGTGRQIDAAVRVTTQMLAHEFIGAALRLDLHKSETGSRYAEVNLTRRQRQCLQLMAAGKSSAEIGRELDLSPRTVDFYVAGACRRLEVKSRAQAVVRAMSLELISGAE